MASSKIPASVEILTLNSEKTVRETLESVKDFDEAFILDGNSTDTTREIAEHYGATIHALDLNGGPNLHIHDFAAARNKADSLARNNWIFYLDSDEFASPELVEEIRKGLEERRNEKVVFTMPYCLIVEGKVARYSFSHPRYVRVYNRTHGVSWKKAKTVHEKIDIPADVRRINLENFFYGHVPGYRECIAKDTHYLAIYRKKIIEGKGVPRNETVRSIFKNAGRAVKIFLVSIGVYLRHGFKESIPPSQAWRYVRYHVIITWLRCEQLVRSFRSRRTPS